MNNMNDQPLSGQQLAQIQKQMAQAVAGTLEKMELRKAAIQAATDIIKATSFPASPVLFTNPVELSEALYNFMVQPAVDINININVPPQ